MDTPVIPKAWYTSKTYQGMIVALATSVYRILAQRFHWAAWSDDYGAVIIQLLQLLGGALTVIGLRTATKPIGDPSKVITVPAIPAGTASGEAPARGGIE